MRRLLLGCTAALVSSLSLMAGTASAETIYNYVYSGQYVDGTGSDVGQFNSAEGISGVAYDKARHRILVVVTGPTTKVVALKENGEPDSFSGLGGSDTIDTGLFLNNETIIEVDNSGGPNDGNIYLADYGFIGGGTVVGFTPAGLKLPKWPQSVGGLCGITVGPEGNPWTMGSLGGANLRRFTPEGEYSGFQIEQRPFKTKDEKQGQEPDNPCYSRLDSQGNLYGRRDLQFGNLKWVKYDPEGHELYELSGDTTPRGDAIDLSNDDVFTIDSYGAVVNQYDREGKKLGSFGGAEPSQSYPGLEGTVGIGVNPENHDLWIGNRHDYGGTERVERFTRELPGIVVPTVKTEKTEGDDLEGDTATLRATLDPENLETETCQFKWGIKQAVPNTVPCDQGQTLTGSGEIQVSATVPVRRGKVYYYRLQSQNKANHRSIISGPSRFIAQGKPIVRLIAADRVNTDGAFLNADLNAGGGNTTYKFEWGSGEGYESSSPTVALRTLAKDEHVSLQITGLTPGTVYHYRISMTDEAGPTVTAPLEFLTYVPDPVDDPCPNALARQQAGASRLMDCRGYELVSAPDSGGYDVESDLIPGQAPLINPVDAGDSVLYSIYSGAIPGIAGSPTNLGRDPYVATRAATGRWSTKYVGLPVDGMAQQGPFGSPLQGTDESLSEFAFGGKDICSPCFSDGSTNIPLRLRDGSLVKGMAGSLNPAADPSQEVAKPFSADGSHFVFGSDQKFDAAGDEGGSIYDRDLPTGATQVVSTDPAGSAIAGGGVGELDISSDGSRIVVGKELSIDAKGNSRWHLYMHLGSASKSVDLTPGANAGVYFSGMNTSGSRLFVTTTDHLLGEDTDASTDIYEVAVDQAGAATLRLVTTDGGTPSNDDGCEPAGTPNSWNSVSGPGRCGAVAFAGGAGVSAANGTLYFVSPEQLDGAEGERDQANLYLVEPGADPRFVAIMDTSDGKPAPQPPNHPFADGEFGGHIGAPAGLAVNQASGDVYVAETGTGTVQRFTAAGAPDDFTAGPGAGTNRISGFEWLEPRQAQVAVDNSPGPANGDVYVVSSVGQVGRVDVYSSTGAHLTTLGGTGTPIGELGLACGVTVDQSNGNLYVGDYFGHVWRYTPSGGTVAEGDYSGGIATPPNSSSCGVATSGANLLVNFYEFSEIAKYQLSTFKMGSPPEPEPVPFASSAAGLSTDPSNGDIYVDQGNKIAVFNTGGQQFQTITGGGLTSSVSVAVNGDSSHVYATSGGEFVFDFGPEQVPFTPIANGAVTHGVQQPETHSYADFQVTPDGRYATFGTKNPITGFRTLGFEQVYRYDSSGEGKVDCVSCAPSNTVPASDTGLPAYGLALTDDGRVFFTTRESFVLRDTNGRGDAYEWQNGKKQLVSLGLGPENSGLLSVTPDGTNALFFTRDTLVPDDVNGSTVKIYDARAGGGLVYDREAQPCKASDECHGPGSQAPSPAEINTQEGSRRSYKPPVKAMGCRKGFVKRNGKCVKKKHHHKKQKKSGGSRG